MINALFEQQGLHLVYAGADDRNVAAHRLLRRLGSRCEARLIEADWFKGEWSSLRIFARPGAWMGNSRLTDDSRQ